MFFIILFYNLRFINKNMLDSSLSSCGDICDDVFTIDIDGDHVVILFFIHIYLLSYIIFFISQLICYLVGNCNQRIGRCKQQQQNPESPNPNAPKKTLESSSPNKRDPTGSMQHPNSGASCKTRGSLRSEFHNIKTQNQGFSCSFGKISSLSSSFFSCYDSFFLSSSLLGF